MLVVAGLLGVLAFATLNRERTAGTAGVPAVAGDTSPAGVAVAMSRQSFPEGNNNVVIGQDTPSGDALAAGGLQGLFDAPLLLSGADGLSDETAAEIDRLGRPTIHILGGEQVMSSALERQLREAGHSTHRHAGPTRMDTAVSVAELHFPTATTAVLIPAYGTGAGVTEQLSASLAAGGLAAELQVPVLLSLPDQLDDATRGYLARSNVEQVIVAADETTISPAVVEELDDLGVEARRVAGPDRFATAVAIARERGFATVDDAAVVILAEGSSDAAWPGGYIAALQSARRDAPILLTSGTTLPEETRRYLTTDDPTPPEVVCMPGVDPTACATARTLLGQ